jgi:hypothetical protein
VRPPLGETALNSRRWGWLNIKLWMKFLSCFARGALLQGPFSNPNAREVAERLPIPRPHGVCQCASSQNFSIEVVDDLAEGHSCRDGKTSRVRERLWCG